MASGRFDLPLESSSTGRYLTWSVGALVYLAVVTLAVAAIADGALYLYSLRAKLVTVTLPSIDDQVRAEREVADALEILQRARGVTSARAVPPEEVRELIQPYLGAGFEGADELPLPRLIDLTLDPVAKPDLATLQAELGAVVPGASIGAEALSRDRAERLAAFFLAWSGGTGIAMIMSVLVVVALITRMSLGAQTDTIELLRFMGASDGYVARQFERHALLSAVRGGLVGFGLAVVTIASLLFSSAQMELAGSVNLDLRPVDWVLLACVPVICALLITAVARLTALWQLHRLP